MSRFKEQPQVDEIRRQRLLAATNVIPWEADAQTWVFTYVGPQVKTLLGYPPEQWYEKDFWVSHIHPEDREYAIEFCEVSLKTLTDFEFEYRMIAADGRAVWLHDVVNVITENGTPQVLQGFMKDITDRKREEEALRKAHEQLEVRVEERTKELRLTESRLNQAQRMAKIGNWERNLATNELWLSDESCRFLGFNPHESSCPYETFLERVHPEDRQHLTDAVQHAVSEAGQYETEFRTVLPDGGIRVVHARAEVVCDEKGRPTRVIGTAQDVTDRVELERGIIVAGEHERKRIGRDLHDGLGQELTGASLRLQGLSQKLTRERSPHTQAVQDVTAMIQNTIAETRRIARDLAHGFSIELGISAALRELVEEVNEHSDVTCRINCSVDQNLHDDEIATHLYRIAQESISNALKHGSAQNIELRFGSDGGSLFLEVLDDGTGIPPEWDRVEGVGLKSMRYRARMLHGRLDIAPRPHGGTRVLCSCPFQLD